MDSPPDGGSLRTARTALCLLWWVVAVCWIPWAVDWAIGSASLERGRIFFGFLALSLGLGGWSLWTGRRPLTRASGVAHILLATLLILLPVVTEVLIRQCQAANVGGFRNPKLFGDAYAEDDYWKLRRKWKTNKPVVLDPLLGWVREKDQGNPLGILREPGYTPQSEDVVLCFGDSFMSGVTPLSHKIPDLLEDQLVSKVAYNFGMGGHGVGQIYLRYLAETPKYVEPIVVIGILTHDLDRSILTVRDGPKPRFRVHEGELVLDPPVEPAEGSDWDSENPVQLRSFAFAMLVQAVRSDFYRPSAEDSWYRREEKTRVNRAILEALVQEAKARDQRLLIVTFPRAHRLLNPGWREQFMRETLDELGVAWIDGRALLLQDMEERGLDRGAYFLKDNHPNERGNQLFASAIATQLQRLWGIELR